MTFDELNQMLPNGFHDAEICSFSVDFVGPSIVIKMSLHCGGPEDRDPERYRRGTVRVVSPFFFFVEPPDPRYRFMPDGAPINASGDAVGKGTHPTVDELLLIIPPGATAYRFFLDDWNSFIYLAGADVEFSWDRANEGLS